MSSSSPRGISPCRAIIESGQTPSPITLPEVEPEKFVAEFSRIYGKLGWRIELTESDQVKVVKD